MEAAVHALKAITSAHQTANCANTPAKHAQMLLLVLVALNLFIAGLSTVLQICAFALTGTFNRWETIRLSVRNALFLV